MRTGRITTGVLLWLVAAAAATAVGMTAVAAIGTDIFGAGRTPLSESEVDQLLASRPPTTTPTTTPATSAAEPTTSRPPERQRTTATQGGTVISRCVPGGLVEVLQAVPAQGYRVDSDDDGADDHPSVRFRSEDREIEVRLRCVGGLPEAEVDDD